MRFHRDEYLDLMTYAPAHRPMFVELFGPLIGLEQEWRAQGATEDEINLTAFDWDYVPIVDFGGYPLPRVAAPVSEPALPSTTTTPLIMFSQADQPTRPSIWISGPSITPQPK